MCVRNEFASGDVSVIKDDVDWDILEATEYPKNILQIPFYQRNTHPKDLRFN